MGAIPTNVQRRYVLTLVALFLTNGHGVAERADGIYRKLIGTFTREQAVLALLSFTELGVAAALRSSLAQRQFREVLVLLAGTLPTAAGPLVALIGDFSGPLANLTADVRVKREVQHLSRLTV